MAGEAGRSQNADSASEKRPAPADGSVPSAQAANPTAIEADKSKSSNKGPANVNCKWRATVKYDWPGAVYDETFSFEIAGSELSGVWHGLTSSLLGADHVIFDGKIEGDQISITTKSLTTLDDKTYEDKHYYKGTVEGDTIRIFNADR